MKARGQYLITLEDGTRHVVPNLLTNEGLTQWMKMIFNSASQGSFYVGLTSGVVNKADLLADAVVGEPTVANGYARMALARNTTDFPIIAMLNNEILVTSKQLDFIAAGADFDKAITRLFLCDAASGATGTLFSYSAPFAASTVIAAGSTFSVQYQLFLS